MKKDPLMFRLMIFCWLCAIAYFNPRILALLVGPENVVAKVSIVFFAVLLDLFWFYAFYHLIIILFSYSKFRVPTKISSKSETPKVALLYTTCNDFKEEAILSCVNQEYDKFHTFILDDSNIDHFKLKIDAFVLGYPETVSVIRRPDRKGYKAGNINYCLKRISDYEYISVSDSDTVLPRDYIAKLLPYFSDPHIAFVQSRQEFDQGQKSAFAQDLGYQIELHYDHYLSVKNRYGFVMFYGHGAMMKTDVLEEMGGFPEVASEDLAYSMEIREKGYYGVYASDVTCKEEFPSTFRQYRKRNEKWIKGTTECLIKYYRSFSKNNSIAWFEKFDVLISALSLLLSLPFTIFLFLVGIILPFFYCHFRFQGPMFKMPLVFNDTVTGVLLGISGNLFWRWDFFAILIITLLAPIFPAIIECVRRPFGRLRFIVMHTFIFYAMQINSAIALCAYLISKKADFPVTADNTGGITNNRLSIAIEWLSVVIFLVVCVISRNIWFLSFAAGIAIGSTILKSGFENRSVRIMAIAPLLILATIILFISKTLK